MRKITLGGSCAIKHHYRDFKREPKDVDYFTDIPLESYSKITEFLYCPII